MFSFHRIFFSLVSDYLSVFIVGQVQSAELIDAIQLVKPEIPYLPSHHQEGPFSGCVEGKMWLNVRLALNPSSL